MFVNIEPPKKARHSRIVIRAQIQAQSRSVLCALQHEVVSFQFYSGSPSGTIGVAERNKPRGTASVVTRGATG
jgi:hypothetical protein